MHLIVFLMLEEIQTIKISQPLALHIKQFQRRFSSTDLILNTSKLIIFNSINSVIKKTTNNAPIE